MNALWHELRCAFAALAQARGFAATVVVTLALTLGALLGVFALNGLLLWKPLPYADAERLVIVHHEQVVGETRTNTHQSFEPMRMLYQRQQTLSPMAMMYQGQALLSSHLEQPRVNVSYVTPEYFELLSVPLRAGSAFGSEHGVDMNKPAALLGERLWRESFGADPTLVGSSVRIGDVDYRVIGIVDAGFAEPQPLALYGASEVWLPWDYHGQKSEGWGSGFSSLHGLGRLPAGGTLAQAHTALDALMQELLQQPVVAGQRLQMHPWLLPLREAIIGDSRSTGLLLLAGAAVLLLIACANVTNLFVSRAAQRQRAIAIQAVLGAKPAQLLRGLMAESALLCVGAATLGLLAAAWFMELLRALATGQLPRLHELGLDLPTVLGAYALALLLAWAFARMACGLLDYERLRHQVQGSGKGNGLQVSARMRNWLVGTQAGLATALLLAAIMVFEVCWWTVRQPLGFETADRVSLRVDTGDRHDAAAGLALSRQIAAALAELPEVREVARSVVTPIRSGNFSTSLFDGDGQMLGFFQTNMVDDRYFGLVGQALLQGRGFTREEIDDGAPVMVVSESAARRLGGNVLGRTYVDGEERPVRIIGVVGDVFNPARHLSDEGVMLFLPYNPAISHFLMALEPGRLLQRRQVLAALRKVDGQLRIANLQTLAELVEQLTWRHRVLLWLTVGLSALTLFLAMVGIFGVLSQAAQMRRHEMGVRLSLGAKPRVLMREMLGESLSPLGVGIASALLAAIAAWTLVGASATAWMRLDASAVGATLLAVLSAALLASWLPLRRAILDDPIRALRNA